MIETAVSLLFSLAITSGLCVALYMGFARVWIERSSYEAVICLATSASQKECERLLRQQIQGALPIGETNKMRLRRDRRSAEVEVNFAIGEKDVLRHRDSRKLPLKSANGKGP